MRSSLLRRNVVGLIACGALAALIPAVRGATSAPKLTPAECMTLWQSAKADLAAAPDSHKALKQAAAVARQMESEPAMNKQAARAYHDISTILGRSKDPRAAAAAAKFLGVARRLGLVGHPMKVFGNLPDGSPFDASYLKGKVVLVDFWATWCGPCRKELPNVKRNFAKYHARGFEVVGVSLDTDPDALHAFLDKEQIPWPVMIGNESTGAGWDSPLALYYGVQSVPTAILIDQNGTVISIHARGAELTERLEQLLGK